MGPHTWRFVRKLRQRRGDERGAEMVEFAIVVVLLITMLYGIVTYGLILAAQSTVTQAAADAARAGIVAGSTNMVNTAQSQAQGDVGWMNKGQCAGNTTATAANPITCVASGPANCPSDVTTGSTAQCLTVTVTYAYNKAPLFPELPGLNVITPSTISSTNVLQIP